jgi:hypothetical protein
MKKSSNEIFCACCRSPRKLRYSRHLSTLNYGQIFFISFLIGSLLFNWLAFKALIILPIVWAIFESVQKSLYRRDLKCPFCGFDPTWYKKDVKLARRKVEEFLRDNPDSPVLRRRRSPDFPLTNYQ